MTDTEEGLVPNIVMKDSVRVEGDGYYVELGEQRFTQAQWELIQLYSQGVANLAVMEAKEEGVLTWQVYHDISEGERKAQIEKGYDASHDDKHGVYHLLTEMQVNLREGNRAAVIGLVQAAREWFIRNRGHKPQNQVRAFHVAMGQPAPRELQQLPFSRIPVRYELIREEVAELLDALGWTGEYDAANHPIFQASRFDMVETVDAAIDILYVVYGLLVEMGVNAEPLFDEVQASNMSKLGEDGKPIIAGPNDPDGIFEGRVKKGPHYFKPNLREVLYDLGWTPGNYDDHQDH
jgi:predicted HAD superfamily Cof-like phosphohydrolase